MLVDPSWERLFRKCPPQGTGQFEPDSWPSSSAVGFQFGPGPRPSDAALSIMGSSAPRRVTTSVLHSDYFHMALLAVHHCAITNLRELLRQNSNASMPLTSNKFRSAYWQISASI
ncbi:unnamed protein product [Aureobasidium pullulans]|nr:unnamed protein product [Aureobasidium pullulans]